MQLQNGIGGDIDVFALLMDRRQHIMVTGYLPLIATMRFDAPIHLRFLPHPAFFCTILPSNDAENHADEGAGRVTRMERSRHSQPRHNKTGIRVMRMPVEDWDARP